MPLVWILFDWGGTLMSEDGPADTPMALLPEVRAIDGAADVVAALAARHRIAVATNATVFDRRSIRDALTRVGLEAFVSEIFCFRDLGVKKADARFWDAVVGRLAVTRAQFLMVGDDLENDVLAPRRAGIASRLVQPEGIAHAGRHRRPDDSPARSATAARCRRLPLKPGGRRSDRSSLIRPFAMIEVFSGSPP